MPKLQPVEAHHLLGRRFKRIEMVVNAPPDSPFMSWGVLFLEQRPKKPVCGVVNPPELHAVLRSAATPAQHRLQQESTEQTKPHGTIHPI